MTNEIRLHSERISKVMHQLQQDMLRRGRDIRMKLISGSMRFSIEIGDDVVIRNTKPEELFCLRL